VLDSWEVFACTALWKRVEKHHQRQGVDKYCELFVNIGFIKNGSLKYFRPVLYHVNCLQKTYYLGSICCPNVKQPLPPTASSSKVAISSQKPNHMQKRVGQLLLIPLWSLSVRVGPLRDGIGGFSVQLNVDTHGACAKFQFFLHSIITPLSLILYL